MSASNGTPTPAPWDQRLDEPDASYARFRTFLALGPIRTLQGAADASNSGAKKREKARRYSGQWSSDSRRFAWRERAHAWDIHCLATHGQAAVVGFVHALEIATAKLLQGMERLEVPSTWKEVTEALL